MKSRAKRLTIPLAGVLMATGWIGATAADAATPNDVISKSATASAQEPTESWTPDKAQAASYAGGDLGVATKTRKAGKPSPGGPPGSATPTGQDGRKPGTITHA